MSEQETLTTEQAQELLEGITPGPWRSSRDDMDSFAPSEEGWMQHVVYVYRGPQVRRKKAGRMRWTTDQPRIGVFAGPLGNARRDAALIAAAPDLARLVLAQAEELVRLKGELANSIELGNGLAARVREYERLWETEVDNAIEDNRRYKAELAELRAHREPS